MSEEKSGAKETPQRDFLTFLAQAQPEAAAWLTNSLLPQIKEQAPKHLLSSLERISQADPENFQQVAAALIPIVTNYYDRVLQQAKQSFLFALSASVVGLLFFIGAVSILLFRPPTSLSASYISLISGALVEVLAAINFYLYGRSSSQLTSFHVRLDRILLFIIANSACEKALHPLG